MAGIFLLLGSNLGDRVVNLQEARKRIETACGPCLQASPVYRTAAWGKTDQPEFLNQALQIQTALLPDKLLMVIQDIEKSMGRERIEKWGTRVIDIDILIYNNHVVRTRDLMLPHPQLENRRFALAPLNDIAADLIHPLSGKKISELLEICPDQLAVERV